MFVQEAEFVGTYKEGTAMIKEVMRGKKKQKRLFKLDAVGKNFLRI